MACKANIFDVGVFVFTLITKQQGMKMSKEFWSADMTFDSKVKSKVDVQRQTTKICLNDS